VGPTMANIVQAIRSGDRTQSTYWVSISVGDSNRGYSHGVASWPTFGTPKRYLTKRIDGREDEVESVLRQVIGMRPGEYVLTATGKSGDQRQANVTIGYNPPRQ
jgi:hypothetical protein